MFCLEDSEADLSTAEMCRRFMYLAPTHDLLLICCQKDGCSRCKIVVGNSIPWSRLKKKEEERAKNAVLWTQVKLESQRSVWQTGTAAINKTLTFAVMLRGVRSENRKKGKMFVTNKSKYLKISVWRISWKLWYEQSEKGKIL